MQNCKRAKSLIKTRDICELAVDATVLVTEAIEAGKCDGLVFMPMEKCDQLEVTPKILAEALAGFLPSRVLGQDIAWRSMPVEDKEEACRWAWTAAPKQKALDVSSMTELVLSRAFMPRAVYSTGITYYHH